MPYTLASRFTPDLVDLGTATGMPIRAGVLARRVVIGPGIQGASLLASAGADPVLVVEGTILRSVQIGHRTSALLHGAGDVLPGSGFEPRPFRAHARALTTSVVVVLDPPVMAAIARTPALAARVADAVDAQAGLLGVLSLLAQLTSIAERLDVLLPMLANRWGTVGADGVLLPGFLTHSVLSELIGVRRPSLTTALVDLKDRGRLRRLDDRRWLLAPEAAGLAA